MRLARRMRNAKQQQQQRQLERKPTARLGVSRWPEEILRVYGRDSELDELERNPLSDAGTQEERWRVSRA